jgi:DNA polymerase V
MGFPSPARDYRQERLDWNKLISNHPLSTFYFRCNSDAMHDAAIVKGAVLAVDRSIIPCNGHIVVASVEGKFTVRYLQKNDHKTKLIAANKKYADIVMNNDMTIFGVVVSVVMQMLR